MIFTILLAVVFLTVFSNPLFAQECDTEKAVKEKTKLANDAEAEAKKALQDFSSLPPLATKPTDNKDATAAKAVLDAAKIKWDKTKEALLESKKNLAQGSDVLSLEQNIANKKNELKEKQEVFKNKDLTSYLKNSGRMAELEKDLNEQMNSFDRKSATEKLGNTSYKKYNPANSTEIDLCAEEKKRRNTDFKDINFKNECISDMGVELLKNLHFKNDEITKLRNELQEAVTATTAAFAGRSTKRNYWQDIQRVGNSLITEIEKVQKSLKGKYQELVKLEGGIKELQGEINSLQREIQTLENQLKPIKDAEKKEYDTKKEYDEAEKKWQEAEVKNTKALNDLKIWEAADKKRKQLEKEKNEAEKAKKEADAAKANAENADAAFKAQATTPLNEAQSRAALNTLDARMRTVNSVLLREAIAEVLRTNTEAARFKENLKQAVEKALSEAQKAKLRQQWSNYIRGLARPHYVGRRNEAEADRLRAIRDNPNLQNFKCIKEVGAFIILLNQSIDHVLALTASLASDVDLSDPADRNIPIPDELIPPLDDGQGKDTPSDEVPDDITKNTGEVKVIRYYVFLLTNASNGLYVGSEESLKGVTSCSFIGGGINCKPTDVVTYKKLLGPFAAQAEAQAALCQAITETKIFPIGVGLKGRWQGGKDWYGLWNASVSDCPSR